MLAWDMWAGTCASRKMSEWSCWAMRLASITHCSDVLLLVSRKSGHAGSCPRQVTANREDELLVFQITCSLPKFFCFLDTHFF